MPLTRRAAAFSTRCSLSVTDLGELSVTLVYCGQTVGWIKMRLDTEVDLGPGRIVLDEDPAPHKGAQFPIFGPCLFWPNGWMDEDATWNGVTEVGLGPCDTVL